MLWEDGQRGSEDYQKYIKIGARKGLGECELRLGLAWLTVGELDDLKTARGP